MAPSLSTLSRTLLVNEYFIENRTKLLDLAGFLDRLDRADGPDSDFRMEAFNRALAEVCSTRPCRIERVQAIFSDPTTEPKPALDQKSASGAWNPQDGMG
jgi:hypothetical protein